MKFFSKHVLLSCVFLSSFSCNENEKSEIALENKPSNHRKTATMCDNFRPTFPVVSVREPNAQPCAKHSDCTEGANGRCSHYPGPGGESDDLYCTYDLCFSDDDCEEDEVCNCGDNIHANNRLTTDLNRCVPSNCKTDDDCSIDHWCKASPSICGDGVIVGYYCTTDEDKCRDSKDCGGLVCSGLTEGEDFRSYFCNGADCD